MSAMETDSGLDNLDRRILQALQANGRATYDEVAAGIGLSASATLRRVKRLEEAGVITGYAAQVAPEKVGLGLTAYINVRLAKASNHDPKVDAGGGEYLEWGIVCHRGHFGFASSCLFFALSESISARIAATSAVAAWPSTYLARTAATSLEKPS